MADLFPHLGSLSKLSDFESRAITAENPTGAKGQGARATEGHGAEAASELGVGWKVSPAIHIEPGAVAEIAAIEGPGVVSHIWMAGAFTPRWTVIRMYWDGQEQPSVEVPLGDFFCNGWNTYAHVNSLAVCTNPVGGYNCFWPMPFRKGARLTVENLSTERATLFYQIDYALGPVGGDEAFFHAQFRRSNPLEEAVPHTLLDGVRGRGHFVGTYLAWQANADGWWGEGEVKFHLDGDGEHPTICGTGTEDYILGAWCFTHQKQRPKYLEFSTPYSGLPQVLRPDPENDYRANMRFGMYRWHVTDPVRFRSDLRCTVQALGWRSGGKRYLPLRDDIASTAFWYQMLPTAPFPALPDKNGLEVR